MLIEEDNALGSCLWLSATMAASNYKREREKRRVGEESAQEKPPPRERDEEGGEKTEEPSGWVEEIGCDIVPTPQNNRSNATPNPAKPL